MLKCENESDGSIESMNGKILTGYIPRPLMGIPVRLLFPFREVMLSSSYRSASCDKIWLSTRSLPCQEYEAFSMKLAELNVAVGFSDFFSFNSSEEIPHKHILLGSSFVIFF